MHLLTQRMEELEDAIETLSQALLCATLVQAEVYQMPFITKEQEEHFKCSPDGIDFLSVTPLEGREALEEAIKAFNHMYVLDETLSTYYVQKWPGVLVFDPSEKQIKSAVFQVNEAKKRFKDEVQLLGDRDEKFEVVHSIFHRLITYAAFRLIHCYDDMSAAYFSWQRRAKSERLSKEDARRKIVNQRGKLSSIDKLVKQRTIDMQISRLEQCRDDGLRLRKPAKIRPLVSIKTSDRLFGTTCGTPIIAFSSNPISITPLPALDNTKIKQRHNTTWRPVVPHLHIYEKQC